MRGLEGETFMWCKNLNRLEIPNGVEYIGEQCFRDSGVEEITLPSTLKGIDKDMF